MRRKAAISPPLRVGLVPPFYQLPDDQFEDLCRDLLLSDATVEEAEVFGTSGQNQAGIDILVTLRDGRVFVAQCKNHQDFTASVLKEACNRFVRHRGQWKTHGVDTFLVVAGADTRATQVQRERLRQRKRFAKLDLKLRIWSGAALARKLESQRLLVRKYVPSLEESLCGRQLDIEIRCETLESANAALVRQLGGSLEQDHDGARQAWREGREAEAVRVLAARRSDPVAWSALPQVKRAKLLRLEARIHISAGRVGEARLLSEEATKLDGDTNRRLQALFAQASNDLEGALRWLEGDPDNDSKVLKGALELQAHRLPAAVATLSELEGNPDALRLLAVIEMVRGSAATALLHIERAIVLAPTWYWVGMTAAVVRYLSGIAPAALPSGLPEWPEPVDPALVRVDADSIRLRRSACAEFRRLALLSTERSNREKACLDAWILACLADDPEHRSEAVEFARVVLVRDPGAYRVMAWVLGRDLKVDLSECVNYLKARIDERLAGIEEIVTVIAALLREQNRQGASEILAEASSRFTDDAATRLLGLWKAQIALFDALDAAGSGSVEKEAAEEDAIRAIEAHSGEQDGARSWRWYVAKARSGDWGDLAPDARRLVAEYRTSEAVRLAIYALFNTADFAGCLDLISTERHLFINGELPSDVRRLKVKALGFTGDVIAAVAEARTQFEASHSGRDLMEFARLCYLAGDLATLVSAAGPYVGGVDFTHRESLDLASVLSGVRPDLAVSLWRRSVATGLEDALVGRAYAIGSRLSLDEELKPLTIRITELGNNGGSGIVALSVADFTEWAQTRNSNLSDVVNRWRQGECPGHVALRALGLGLDACYREWPSTTELLTNGASAGAVLFRSGSRELRTPVGRGRPHRLHADLTSLLTAEQFGLLELIEDAFAPIRLPQLTIAALKEMAEDRKVVQPRRIRSMEAIRSAVSSGKISTTAVGPNQSRWGGVSGDTAVLLDCAETLGGVALLALPLTGSNDEVLDLPHELAQLIRDAPSVLESLVSFGVLESTAAGLALGAMGRRDCPPVATTFSRGMSVFSQLEPLLVLEGAGLLPLALANFRFFVTPTSASECARVCDGALEAEAASRWLNSLERRLSEGTRSGKYELMPLAVREDGENVPSSPAGLPCTLVVVPAIEKPPMLGLQARALPP